MLSADMRDRQLLAAFQAPRQLPQARTRFFITRFDGELIPVLGHPEIALDATDSHVSEIRGIVGACDALGGASNTG